MINGFKEFILRGNVIDLAVAVVIGAAFSKIIDVIVASLINPLVGLFFNAESLDKALVLQVPTLFGGESSFAFGAILGAVINFVAVALVVYLVFVMPMNKYKDMQAAKAGVGTDEETPAPTEQELLTEIRDLLARGGQAAPPRA